MVGGIKTISAGVKSTSSDMFLDSTTMSAPCAMKRVLKAAAHRSSALRYASAPRHVHSRVYALWTQSEDLSVFLAFTRSGLRCGGATPVVKSPKGKAQGQGPGEITNISGHRHPSATVECNFGVAVALNQRVV